MNHLEFAASESSALEPTAWDLWIKETERLAKGHEIGRDEAGNLDGDQGRDGFSMDGAFDAFGSGKTPAGYLLTAQRNIRAIRSGYLPRRPLSTEDRMLLEGEG